MPVYKVQPPIGRGAKSITLGGSGAKSKTLLGRLAELGPQREVWLDLDGEHVIAIVGKRGSGKTHTLGVVVEGLSSASRDSQLSRMDFGWRHAVVIFDTLNLFQWVDLPLSEAKGPQAERQRKLLAQWRLQPAPIEPTFWHPVGSEPATSKSSPFSINPVDMDAQDWGRLLDVDIAAEPMGQLLNDVYAQVQRRHGTRAGSATQPYTVDDLISILRSDGAIQADYSPETIRGIRQRLSALSRSSLFDSKQPDWKAALKPGHVAVFLLGRVPEDLRSVLVFLVIRRLLESRSAASETAKHAAIVGGPAPTDDVPPTWLVIDEAQNILPSRNAKAANDILTRFVREGRNFGLSLAVTTQQPSSIDPRVMAQVDTLIAHNLTVRTDVNYILSNLKSADPEQVSLNSRTVDLADSLRLLEPGQCMISAVESPRLVFCDIRPRLTVHGGFEG
jgi:DNA helicase HerA-like ATPase